MIKRILLVGVLCVWGAVVSAQDWTAGTDNMEYDCTVYQELSAGLEKNDPDTVSDFGSKVVARTESGSELTVVEYIGITSLISFTQADSAPITEETLFADAQAACNPETPSTTSTTSSGEELFNVIANSNGNIRSCAGTNCAVVRKVKGGELLTVLAEEGDWYQIEDENGPAYIATFLVTRGPDTVIDIANGFDDPRTGCRIVFDIKRGDANLDFAIAGERQSDVVVDLYKPNNTIPLEVEAQLDKAFTDTGEPYIHQYYYWNTRWPLGTYQLEISLDGETSLLAWEMEEEGDYTIFVLCD